MSTSTCDPEAFAKNSNSTARSTNKPPPTATSAANTPTSPGNTPPKPTPSAPPQQTSRRTPPQPVVSATHTEDDTREQAVTMRLVVTCPDRVGIVAAVARFLAEAGANIESS